jgi:membrane fusion protein, heavy metal efflux system
MKLKLFYSLAAFFLFACNHKRSDEKVVNAPLAENLVTLTDAQIKNAGIVTGKIEEKEISSILKVNGKVDVPPQNMVSISVPLGGYLKTTKLLPGMHVKKGESIAVMEDQQYIQLQQDYLSAKAKLGFMENEYLRQKDLNQSKASSDKVYQQAEADYESQKILIASLSEKLKLVGIDPGKLSITTISKSISVYSPIDGYVSKVNVNIGKYVSPTEVLFELINPTDIHLALKVFEKDLDKLFIGQQLIAFTNHEPLKKHRCEILLIGKDIYSDRSTDVHCHFEDYDKTLIPGTYMNAEIEVKNNRVRVLPDEALVRYNNKQFAFTKKTDNQFEMVEINTGDRENGFTEVLISNEMALKEFVKKGAYSLLMSLKNKSEE